MIEEAYVSFETAKLLKEKGFDEEVLTYYIYDTESKSYVFRFDDRWDNPNNFPGYCISAPTQQMAMRWLREVHDIFIAIEIVPHVTVTMEQKYYFFKLYKDRRPCISPLSDSVRLYSSYEEVTEAAIQYCLENLI